MRSSTETLTSSPDISLNYQNLKEELFWLKEVMTHQLHSHFKQPSEFESIDKILPPQIDINNSTYFRFLVDNNLNFEERLILILVLSTHISPNFLDSLIQELISSSGEFPQIGGVRGKNFRGFLPTGETALFLLAGGELAKRFEIQKLFDSEHFFAKNQMLWLEEPPSGEPLMSGKIIISQEYVDLFTFGKISSPRFSISFPAQRIETRMEWEDLVLNEDTMNQVKELEVWIKYGQALMKDWGMEKRLNPGFRVLFHGPPGTGKTLTASLLGKYTGKEVYKIDLSMVVSKFIGETEKNLANLFDKAENKDWILFFDEADALFGKRTSVRDAHDKYANQEVSFLLQRTESYSGLVILATNLKNNIDDAFARRFQSHIYFPSPAYGERLKIWQKAFPENVKLEDQIQLPAISRQYELTGANIMNAVQHACLQTLASGSKKVVWKNLLSGIQKEYSKEGKNI